MLGSTPTRATVFFCLVFNAYGSVIVIEKTPDVVLNPLTEFMTVRCSLKDTARSALVRESVIRDVTETAKTIKRVNSIVVMRNDNNEHVAMVVAGFPPSVSTDIDSLNVTGDVDVRASDHGYLKLTWHNPTEAQSGDYKCEINAMDILGHTVVFSTLLKVNVRKPDFNDLVNHVVTLKHDMTASIQQAKEEVNENLTQLKNELETERKISEFLKGQLLWAANQTNQLSIDLNEAQHIETGTVSCGNGTKFLGNVHVHFTQPYKTIPHVFVTLFQFRELSNMSGFYTYAHSVATHDFYVRCYTTIGHVDYLDYTWISIPFKMPN